MDIIAAPTNGYICVNVGGVEGGGGAILGCRKKIEGGGYNSGILCVWDFLFCLFWVFLFCDFRKKINKCALISKNSYVLIHFSNSHFIIF